jgi:hypothetical protein
MNVFVFILATLRRQKSIRRWEDGNMGRKFSIIPSPPTVDTFSATQDFYSRIEGFGMFKD